MSFTEFPATFMRGGTSKAPTLRKCDVPADPAEGATLPLSAMGSPDPFGRRRDGMGGGVSSVSKVCIVERSTRDDAEVARPAGDTLRVGMPSGVPTADADVIRDGESFRATRGSFFRTARPLMRGVVYA